MARRWWVLWLASIVLTAGAVASVVAIIVVPGALASTGGIDVYVISFLILAPIYASVGAVIVSRGSGNRVGWFISAIGLCIALQDFAGDYSAFVATPQGRSLPAGLWMNWIGNWIWVPAILGALTLLPIYFPDGRLPSPRWRPLVSCIWIVAGIVVASTALSPGIVTANDPGWVNPVGLGFLDSLAGTVHSLYIATVLVGVIAGATSLVVRYRRGTSDARHQVKWFAGAFGFVALTIAAYAIVTGALSLRAPGWLIAFIMCLGLTVIPIAVAIAVLKYRLYDIDVVINRALVYGSLAGFITLVYIAIVVGFGALIGGGGKPNLALSIVATAIVAVAFQSVRDRVQRVANRVVYGKRASPYEVLSQFSERVSESYAADDVLPRMARVLAEGTGAERAGVWLRFHDSLRQASSWPPDALQAQDARLTTDALPDITGIDRAVEVRHQGELLGALTVTKRTGESLTPVEEKLLDDLAHQAGLVLKNVGLTADLLQRLEDLRASRQRLVAAQDEERRRLERNLHDGAQQNLVALKVKLGLVELIADKDPARARTLIAEVKCDADDALETLRDLARGIYPPLLAERGLGAALESQARKATIPVSVDAEGIGRHAPEIEAAIYFCCLEALQNVQKYGAAKQATVRISESDSALSFKVEDDGCGFDTASTKRGSGLQNMEDRLDALGGSLFVTSLPGFGTTLTGSIPVRELVAA